MLNWLGIIKFIRDGNPKPNRRVERTEEEWRALLNPEQYHITREKGTEQAYTGAHCSVFEPALYGCVCCGNWLFDSREKFESGSGWPSFTQPVTENAIKYVRDNNHGMSRVEVLCNVCDAHLGHIFPDGPMPSGLRYCINSAALRKVRTTALATATLGGGCFWCTEALFRQLEGVESVQSGYSGGHPERATYEQVSVGVSGHAEVVQVIFNEEVISYAELVRYHLQTHDPTTLNRQGADKGKQYRSVIFYHDEDQRATARRVIDELQPGFAEPIVTELAPFEAFYRAEALHQDFYRRNPDHPYCRAVIAPKLAKVQR